MAGVLYLATLGNPMALFVGLFGFQFLAISLTQYDPDYPMIVFAWVSAFKGLSSETEYVD